MRELLRNLLKGETAARPGLETSRDVLQQMRVFEVSYDAEEVEYDLVKLSKDEYVEVAPGILDRILEGPHDIKYDFEKPYQEQIANLNFSIGDQILVRSARNGFFKKHKHPFAEAFTIFSGTTKMFLTDYHVWRKVNRQMVKIAVPENYCCQPGDIVIIPPGTGHYYDIQSTGPGGWNVCALAIADTINPQDLIIKSR